MDLKIFWLNWCWFKKNVGVLMCLFSKKISVIHFLKFSFVKKKYRFFSPKFYLKISGCISVHKNQFAYVCCYTSIDVLEKKIQEMGRVKKHVFFFE